MHRSLLVRLLAVSALVAVCAIAATAWLAARTTSGAIQQEQGQALADDSKIYQGLLGYASKHQNWADVGPLVDTYSQITGRRVVLTTPERAPIADSAKSPGPLPIEASATVDPLSVDSSLVADSAADRIDPQAVGPFDLSQAERDDLQALATRVLKCVQDRAGFGNIVTSPSGHPTVVSPDPYVDNTCKARVLSQPTKTEQVALNQLNQLVNDCLARSGQTAIAVQLDLSWFTKEPAGPDTDRLVQGCITSARHEQLTPFVAPPALLFITNPSGVPPSAFDLSSQNWSRIAGVAGGVLLLTIVVTVLAGSRLIRPLRALTGAAQRMGEGDIGARVVVKSKDEIGKLAAAFNAMSESRERLEGTRKAMVSDIAHELRTPLSNIRGWLEATQDGVSKLDQTLVSSLLEEALHLQHIIDDLQDLAMADAGTLRLHQEAISASDILHQVATAHSPRAAAANVELVVHSSPELDLSADPVRLRQAVDNLVSNAIRHTPGGGTVTVQDRREGDDVVFEVIDTGVGIDEEDLPYVFDRFWRADKSRNRQSGGSGLGLAIVRKLAEGHGGTVTATSVPGQGSTFILRLPAESAATA
ncbi:HAMP domain-containing sensor histidine kinase [Amycolatopsis sp.]|uniref:sensor histidine kinase n=1 Tax=Amycolatopsis sp. TaxID=37632 RepID=UPI002E03D1ED|nr:HAMP domain-containing sensor histidine kinase [Amycolatopsis sp.]